MSDGPCIVEVPLDEENLERHVAKDGAKCAAWLVNRFRKKLRRSGEFGVYRVAGEKEPPWFTIAVAFLEKREGWRITRDFRSDALWYRFERLQKSTPLACMRPN